VKFNVKIVGSIRLGLHPETAQTGLSSICSGTRSIQCTDPHNRPVITISADTWTVQLRFPDELQAFCGGIYDVFKAGNNPKPPSSHWHFYELIPQLGQAAPEDFVTYLIVTAEVGLPDAV